MTRNTERREKYAVLKELSFNAKEARQTRDWSWMRLAKLGVLKIELGYDDWKELQKYSKLSFPQIEKLGPAVEVPEEPGEWEDDISEPDKRKGGSP